LAAILSKSIVFENVIHLETSVYMRSLRCRLRFGPGYASDEFEEGRNILYLISATEDLVPDPAPFDHSRAAAFEERLVGVLNAGALCLMTSLGHRVGLFDAMADMPAAGSEAIAARCGLNERYVREWLGAMVASGVVDYDPRDGTYALPPEHAAFLEGGDEVKSAWLGLLVEPAEIARE
jgi:hypothetical protein